MFNVRLITPSCQNYHFVDCCICMNYHNKNQRNNRITPKLTNKKTPENHIYEQCAQSSKNSPELSRKVLHSSLSAETDTQCFDTTLSGPSLHHREICHEDIYFFLTGSQ